MREKKDVKRTNKIGSLKTHQAHHVAHGMSRLDAGTSHQTSAHHSHTHHHCHDVERSEMHACHALLQCGVFVRQESEMSWRRRKRRRRRRKKKRKKKKKMTMVSVVRGSDCDDE